MLYQSELYSHKSEPDNVGSVSPYTIGIGVKKEMPRIELGYRYSGTRGTIIYTNPPSIATSDTFPYFMGYFVQGETSPHVKFFRGNVGFAPTTNYRKVRLSAL